MKHVLFFILLPVMLISLTACASHHNTAVVDETGQMPVLMNLAPAWQHGFNVTRVNVTITKGDFTFALDMVIDSTTASGTFTELAMGTYAIDVAVYENELLIATGQGTGTVSPGQTTTAHITLQFVPGGLEVIINWGLPYEDSRRVLMVGNSHTYYNDGVNTHLQAMLDLAHPEWGTVIQAQTVGGYTLQNHFNDPATINAIQTGNWDLVILQEASGEPYNNPASFYHYATLLDSVITHSGALTGFYMTWAWRNNPEMFVPVRNAYNYIGAYLDGLVVPCGISFHNSWAADSSIVIFDLDNYHPSLYGTYLAACTFLAAIWDVNPVGIRYYPAGINETVATYLQNIAWTTVQNYNNGRNERLIGKLSRFVETQPWQPESAALKLAR